MSRIWIDPVHENPFVLIQPNLHLHNSRCTACFNIRWYIFTTSEPPAYKCMLANLYKLVYSAAHRQECIITNYHMPAICVLAHDAIVAHMQSCAIWTVSHDQAIVANLGCPSVLTATVNRYKLTDGSIVANFHSGFFAFIFKILRYSANYSTRKNAAVLSNAGAFHDGNIAAIQVPSPISTSSW